MVFLKPSQSIFIILPTLGGFYNSPEGQYITKHNFHIFHDEKLFLFQ